MVILIISVIVFLALHLAPGDPVVLVMHGMSRTAEKERDTWQELVLENRFLLIVPEFSQRDFPGSRNYNLGNLSGPEGQPVSRELWTFSAIEPLFDNVKKRYRMTTPSYSIFGHSAGAQFVHRFLFLFDGARVERAVAANAGWYTMPDFNIPYPYGLADSRVTPEKLRHALGLPLTVLLGDRDTDVAHESLRTTFADDRQQVDEHGTTGSDRESAAAGHGWNRWRQRGYGR